jgi:hypothetical protein
VVHPRVGDNSPELGVGVASSRVLGGTFIGTRGRMAAWARASGEGPTMGQTGAAAALLVPAGLAVAPAAPAAEEYRRMEHFLRGKARFCGPAEDL